MRREKIFGAGRACKLDRNARARVTMYARTALQQSGPGRPSRALDVLRALLSYLGNRSGLCYPAYESIARRAGCHRSTVAEALKQLESIAVLTWQHRLIKVRERVADLFGIGCWRWRVLRTSNAYRFFDPRPPANFPPGKEQEDSCSYSCTAHAVPATVSVLASPLERALANLGAAIRAKNCIEAPAGIAAATWVA
jgi:Helix-turn-helix domain